MAVVPPPLICLDKGSTMGFLPQSVWARVPFTQMSGQAHALIGLMAFDCLPKVWYSPQQLVKGGTKARTLSTDVLMILSRNATILLVPLVALAALMAMPIV